MGDAGKEEEGNNIIIVSKSKINKHLRMDSACQ